MLPERGRVVKRDRREFSAALERPVEAVHENLVLVPIVTKNPLLKERILEPLRESRSVGAESSS